MAATRKLQAEIDRCMKKIAEGNEKFEEIWHKFQNASNSNQKEKYEEEMKKEIKKLQRMRDQLKSWCASGDIKDKSLLYEKRRLIEQHMERFKAIERETKIKAYSKEGLTSGAKLDPAEQECFEISQWLNNCLESLNIQIDQFEAEIELLQTGKKKKNKNEKTDKIEEYNSLLEKHRDHVQKLETILRMLDNKTVEISQIQNIKDDVEYYIQNCQEPDFMENDMIYDDIDGLEEMLLEIGCHDHRENSMESMTPETLSSTLANFPSPMVHSRSISEDVSASNDVTLTDKQQNKSPIDDDTKAVTRSSPQKETEPTSSSQTNQSPPSARSTPSSSAAAVSLTAVAQASSSSAPKTDPAVRSRIVASADTGASKVATSNGSNIVNNPVQAWSQVAVSNTVARKSVAQQQPVSVGKKAHPSGLPVNDSVATSQGPTWVTQPTHSSAHPTAGQGGANPSTHGKLSSSSLQQNNFSLALQNGHSSSDLSRGGSTTATTSSAAATNHPSATSSQSTDLDSSSSGVPRPSTSLACLQTSQAQLDGLGAAANIGRQNGSSQSSQIQRSAALISPLLGVSPLGPVPLKEENLQQIQMLEAAFQHMPHPSDSERLRPFLPRNPCTTPAFYPQLPPTGSDTVEFFQKLSTETLFFIFYFMEGTKAQCLAAKALKRMSWRFHSKYLMWFQRHEEPKVINADFEQGSYIYFDFEKWGQRKKEGFTFEYRFLEDHETC